MRVSVVATGIEAEAHQEQARAASPPRGAETASRAIPGTGYMQPVLTQNAAAPAFARRGPRRTGRRREAGRRTGRTGSAGGQRGRERGGARRRVYRAAPGRSRPGPADAGRATGRAAGRRRGAGCNAATGPRAEPDRAGDRHRPLPAGGSARRRRAPPLRSAQPATPPRPPQQRLAPLEEPRPTQPQPPEQGRRSARHPGLSAPPGELTRAERRISRIGPGSPEK